MATKNAIPGFDPNRGNNYTLKPDAPATQTNGGAGGGTKTTSTDPSAPAPGGFDVGPLHFGFTNAGVPGVSYPGSQRVHDWQSRATNAMGLNLADPLTATVGGPDLPTLRAQREAVNQRMPLPDRVTADIAGQINPTQLLNGFPVAGPALQGATQEGIRSYAGGDPWPTIASKTVMGGLGGGVAGKLGSPQSLAELGSKAWTMGVPGLVSYAVGGNLEHGLLGALAGKEFLEGGGQAIKNAGEAAGEWAGPAARAALQNLIMGGASSFIQNNPTPPPLPGFGYPGN